MLSFVALPFVFVPVTVINLVFVENFFFFFDFSDSIYRHNLTKSEKCANPGLGGTGGGGGEMGEAPTRKGRGYWSSRLRVAITDFGLINCSGGNVTIFSRQGIYRVEVLSQK